MQYNSCMSSLSRPKVCSASRLWYKCTALYSSTVDVRYRRRNLLLCAYGAHLRPTETNLQECNIVGCLGSKRGPVRQVSLSPGAPCARFTVGCFSGLLDQSPLIGLIDGNIQSCVCCFRVLLFPHHARLQLLIQGASVVSAAAGGLVSQAAEWRAVVPSGRRRTRSRVRTYVLTDLPVLRGKAVSSRSVSSDDPRARMITNLVTHQGSRAWLTWSWGLRSPLIKDHPYQYQKKKKIDRVFPRGVSTCTTHGADAQIS